MREELKKMKAEAEAELRTTSTLEELHQVRVKYLGKKGRLTAILRGMGSLPPEERPVVGQIANEIRDFLEKEFSRREEEIKQKIVAERLEKERIDVTLPGRVIPEGSKHPLSLVLEEIEDIFLSLGFEVVEGPEVELDYYNFEALNIPPEHPARDMQDSFYITSEVLLRTHTSPTQPRVMEQRAPNIPVRVIAPGKVYRRDDDATHSPMFHQVEGFVIDRRVTLADLKGTLLTFARRMFGEKREIRLRPSFFPFTEPSAEVDISCMICEGKGCRVCSGTGWLEVLGAGLIHPRVLEMSGYNPREVTG
ncbi:MAG: phenylalanyl-tRNA synthetase alpha chain, partial [Eubacteriales bacterium]|nr:phenylalanyl-tRNA synthetase alpha chain [Eubacteriales bacterium]